MRQFSEITENFRGFIEKQRVFFVGTAGPDSDLSPRRHRERGGESCEEIFSRQGAKTPSLVRQNSEVITAEVRRAQRKEL